MGPSALLNVPTELMHRDVHDELPRPSGERVQRRMAVIVVLVTMAASLVAVFMH